MHNSHIKFETVLHQAPAPKAVGVAARCFCGSTVCFPLVPRTSRVLFRSHSTVFSLIQFVQASLHRIHIYQHAAICTEGPNPDSR